MVNLPISKSQIIGEGEDSGHLLAALFVVEGGGHGGRHLAARHGTNEVRAAERWTLAWAAGPSLSTEMECES